MVCLYVCIICRVQCWSRNAFLYSPRLRDHCSRALWVKSLFFLAVGKRGGRLTMSLLPNIARFSRAGFGHPLLLRQGIFVRMVVGHGFATGKAKPAEVVVSKRPPNAYVMFLKAERPNIVRLYPVLAPKEIMRILSSRWKAMSEEEKKPYKDASNEKMRIYNAPLAKLPKKPPGIFGLFVKENYSTAETLNPGAKVSDVMIELSREWNGLSDTEKEEWFQKREEMMEDYNEEVKNFGKGLSAEERAFLEEKQSVLLQKLKKEQRQLLGYPRRPPSAFILFSQRNMLGFEELTMTERTKMLGKKWQELPESEKEEYLEESRKARKKYDEDVAEWMKNNPEVL